MAVWVVMVMAGGSGSSDCKPINKTKYLMNLGIHKSIKTEFIIKLNENKLGNACCH